MSSNLVKLIYTAASEEKEKRVIDNNELIRRRLALLAREDGEAGGFVSGIVAADVVEVPEDATGNVIKAQDEVKDLLERARTEADAVLEQARAEAERIREEAMAQAEAEKAQAISQARQQGYNEGMVKAKTHEEALEEEYREKGRSLEAAYQEQIDTLEPQFVDAITGIYEHIFHVELSSYREILTSLLSDVLHKAEGSRSFIIHVSKDDYAYVSMQKNQITEGVVSESTAVDVVEDMTLDRNECMIETENGIFDCGLGTQLSELKRRLTLLAYSKS